MPSVVLDLNHIEDTRDVVHQAVAAFSEGKIVALPTETVYGLAASALNADSVKRLGEIKGRESDKPFAFAIKSYEDALDYVPDMSPLARRLARRCWPGPVTLVLPDSHPDSVLRRLPESVQQAAVPTGTVGLRVPAHTITQQILRLLAGPIVLTSANLSNEADCIDGQQIVEKLGDRVDLVIDDGKSRFAQPSSVVKVENKKVEILRSGVIDEKTLNRLTGFIAVVVCTGNTCRSPMGELILKQHLAERMGCEISELDSKNITVMSAGIAAASGASAANQAVEVMNESGLDLSNHLSQPFTQRLADFADLVLTMTAGHRAAIVNAFPQTAPRTHLIREDGMDVSDPIGLPVDVYRSTAEQISENLKKWAHKADIEI